jgi:hypothetical protein
MEQNYFIGLVNAGQYNGNVPADRIALLAVYMDMIRDEVYSYVDLWNYHKIRRDRTRPNIVTGKPWWLYRHPQHGAENHARAVDQELCDELLSDCEHWSTFLIALTSFPT